MKVLILANSGMGLYKFRKELITELINGGHQVFISIPEDDYVPSLKELGCTHIKTKVDRRGTNPISDFILFLHYIMQTRKIKPDIVLTYTIKPNVYGGIACRMTGVQYIANITGLGTAFESSGFVYWISKFLYKVGLKKSHTIFFQNEENMRFFKEKLMINGRLKLVPGSGVNLNQFTQMKYPQPNTTIRFLFIGRIMREKGIEELLNAAIEVKNKYPNVIFDLIGGCEEEYNNKLNDLDRRGIINYWGHQDNIHNYIMRSHAIILPSYHEGLSNVLLEAASSGRPVLASNIPGCQETFDDGVSGIGFQVMNTESLINAIISFIRMPYEKKSAMGDAGRKKVENEFDRKIVVNQYLDEINMIKKGCLNESI